MEVLVVAVLVAIAAWILLMAKPVKFKPKPSCGGDDDDPLLLKVVSRINEQFHMLLQLLRRIEDTNQKRHEELLKTIESSKPPNVRTMVFVRKRREKITK